MSTMSDTNSSPKRQKDENDEQNGTKRLKRADAEKDKAQNAVEVNYLDNFPVIGNMETDSDEDTDIPEEEEDEEENGVKQNGERSSNAFDLNTMSINDLLTEAELSYEKKECIEEVFVRNFSTYQSTLLGQSAENWEAMLRHFGGVITNLYIDHSIFADPAECIKVNRFVNEYCSDSLVKLTIKNAPKVMNNIIKPFSKLEMLVYEDCYLSGNSTQFNQWFPMMRRLVLVKNELTEHNCIAVRFPHLDGLIIDQYFKSDVAKKALQMNTKLRELKITGFSVNASFLKNVCKTLPHLETLEFKLDGELPFMQSETLCRSCKVCLFFVVMADINATFLI